MPKYYCDYCDTFLTHDSPSVRKTHNGGRKHKENVRMYYQQWMEQQAQRLVDATARAFTQQQRLGPRPATQIPMPQPPTALSYGQIPMPAPMQYPQIPMPAPQGGLPYSQIPLPSSLPFH